MRQLRLARIARAASARSGGECQRDFSDLTSSGSGDGPWTVTGSVDAGNSFGAPLRSRFVCTTHREGEGDWVLHNLTGLR